MKKIFKTEGMHCNSCATSIEMELEERAGIKKVNSDFASEETEIEFDESKISEKEIIEAITKFGFKVR